MNGQDNELVELDFPTGKVPLDLWYATQNNPKLAKIVARGIARSLTSEWEFRSKHQRLPQWVVSPLWWWLRWWRAAPLWEKVCTIVFAPITIPVGLAIALFPLWLLVCIIWIIVATIIHYW